MEHKTVYYLRKKKLKYSLKSKKSGNYLLISRLNSQLSVFTIQRTYF
jgi:hypothetical protein